MVERQFAELIATDHFRLRRAQAIEENTFALGHYNRAGAFEAEHPQVHDAMTQARVFDFNGKTFQNLSLYEQRINRRMLNNLKALHDLQDRRKAQEREAAREAALEAGNPKAFAANANRQSDHENGFGFSCTQTPPQPTSETPPLSDQKAA
jgi:hypothetical protein